MPSCRWRRHRLATVLASIGVRLLDICLVTAAGPADDCQSIEVWQAEVPEAERKEDFAVRNAVHEGKGPGRYAVACPLVRDHDADGFRDLLLERKWWAPVVVGKPEVAFADRELLWMRFDPEQRRFLQARLLEDHEPVDEACWIGRIPASDPA